MYICILIIYMYIHTYILAQEQLLLMEGDPILSEKNGGGEMRPGGRSRGVSLSYVASSDP